VEGGTLAYVDGVQIQGVTAGQVEEAAAVAEEHRHDVELDLVDQAGGERRLPCSRALYDHVGVSGLLPCSADRLLDRVDVGEPGQRSSPDRGGRRA
jgi:hypothetical protein